MAKRMVTRTVAITTGTAVAVDVNDLKVIEMSFQLTGEYKTPELIMKRLTPEIDGLKVMAVKNIEKKQVRYGMSEEDFILQAMVLPPLPERTKETEAE